MENYKEAVKGGWFCQFSTVVMKFSNFPFEIRLCVQVFRSRIRGTNGGSRAFPVRHVCMACLQFCPPCLQVQCRLMELGAGVEGAYRLLELCAGLTSGADVLQILSPTDTRKLVKKLAQCMEKAMEGSMDAVQPQSRT